MEETLNPKESLRLISETLRCTQENFAENSFGFKLWGWLIAIASFTTYFLLSQSLIEFPYLPFPVMAITGVFISIWHYRKKRSEDATQTYLNYYLNQMWLVLGVSFFITVFVSVQNNIQPFSYTLIIAGIGTMISGLVMKFRPMQAGGLAFLAAVIISVFVSDDIRPLVHGIAIVLGYLVPGYLLAASRRTDDVP
ncbi:MAG TPA: hypothetical protein VGB63_10370 [Pedobacter sp.]|jgi:hypothetical protein